jgi:aromatic-L-amino-acid decarboxylase
LQGAKECKEFAAKLEIWAPTHVFIPVQVMGREDADSFNASILNRVIRRGRVYISNAEIHGHFALRACIVNHHSIEDYIRFVVSEVLAAAKELQ